MDNNITIIAADLCTKRRQLSREASRSPTLPLPRPYLSGPASSAPRMPTLTPPLSGPTPSLLRACPLRPRPAPRAAACAVPLPAALQPPPGRSAPSGRRRRPPRPRLARRRRPRPRIGDAASRAAAQVGPGRARCSRAGVPGRATSVPALPPFPRARPGPAAVAARLRAAGQREAGAGRGGPRARRGAQRFSSQPGSPHDSGWRGCASTLETWVSPSKGGKRGFPRAGPCPSRACGRR